MTTIDPTMTTIAEQRAAHQPDELYALAHDSAEIPAATFRRVMPPVMLRNFTPHAIHLGGAPGGAGWLATYESEGAARCSVSLSHVRDHDVVVHDHAGQGVVPTGTVREVREVLGSLEGLPDQEQGVLLIVSRIAAEAGSAAGRTDLRFPAEVQRGKDGNPSHCLSLGVP